MMELISDILLIAGALGAAFYCIVLSRRLNRFTNLEKGVGGAIAVLSAQVDDMTRMLGQAQGTAAGSTSTLAVLTERAEDVAKRLELLVASMHDLPTAPPDVALASKPVPDPVVTKLRPESEPEAEPKFRSRRTWTQEAAE